MKIIYVNYGVKNYLKEDHHSYMQFMQLQVLQVSCKSEKNSGLYGIRILDLCDTGEALYQLSEQANCEQVVELVCLQTCGRIMMKL